MTIEPFLSRLPNYLEQDQDTEIYFRELIDWIESGFDNFRNLSDQLDLDDAIENDFSNSNQAAVSNNETNRTITIDGVSLTVLNGQVANVLNGGNVVLDSTPERDYRIEVRNADGSSITVTSPNKTINGSTTITINTQYTVRIIQYFIETDEFGVL